MLLQKIIIIVIYLYTSIGNINTLSKIIYIYIYINTHVFFKIIIRLPYQHSNHIVVMHLKKIFYQIPSLSNCLI